MSPIAFESAALSWVLTYALHSSLLLGLAWLASRTLARRSLRWRETLWKTALAGSVLTASAQLALDVEPLAGRLAFDAPREASTAFVPSQVERTARPAPRAAAPLERPSEHAAAIWPFAAVALELLRVAAAQGALAAHGQEFAPAPEPERSRNPSPAAPEFDVAPPPAPTASAWRNAWPQLLLGAWIAGGLAGLALLAAAWTRIADLVAGRRALRDGPLHDQLVELCRRARMKRAPRLCISPRITSPATVGVLRPQICVPVRALDELDEGHREAMLAHELAHVARRDPQWSFLCRLLERAFFFQPLNRMARRELAEIAEYRADDWAVRQTGRGLCLARCLAEVAGWIIERRPAVGMLPMATRGSQLGRRIERLLTRDEQGGADERGRAYEPEGRTAPLALGSLALVTLVLPGAAASVGPLRASEPEAEARRAASPRIEGDSEQATSERRQGAALAISSAEPRRARTQLASDIESMVVLLDREVRELLAEVDELSRSIERNGLHDSFAPALERVDARVRELRAGKERLQRLVPAVLDLVAGEAAGASEERHDIEQTDDVTAPGTRGAGALRRREELGSEERR